MRNVKAAGGFPAKVRENLAEKNGSGDLDRATVKNRRKES